MLEALPSEILLTNPKNQLIEILTPPCFSSKSGEGGSKFRNFSDIKSTNVTRKYRVNNPNQWYEKLKPHNTNYEAYQGNNVDCFFTAFSH